MNEPMNQQYLNPELSNNAFKLYSANWDSVNGLGKLGISKMEFCKYIPNPCHEDDLLAHDVLRSYCNKEGPGRMDDFNRKQDQTHRIKPR